MMNVVSPGSCCLKMEFLLKYPIKDIFTLNEDAHSFLHQHNACAYWWMHQHYVLYMNLPHVVTDSFCQIMLTNSLCVVTAAWLNSSKKSWDTMDTMLYKNVPLLYVYRCNTNWVLYGKENVWSLGGWLLHCILILLINIYFNIHIHFNIHICFWTFKNNLFLHVEFLICDDQV